ncbi:hypothetical protein O6H91_23G031700 [Diphasiastrum complanatum]|uniref:Uncharacterized protein n=1 Tax=Diphasiastrum complanatum TaxID=34168 RepID=A0ACC2A9R9_DIPCM|nr:hypothetical protein O6H91_23G031700 [Diphasiastrum complanatum]
MSSQTRVLHIVLLKTVYLYFKWLAQAFSSCRWLVKPLSRCRRYWVCCGFSFAIMFSIIGTWYLHAFIGCKPPSSLHSNWNVLKEMPIDRRMIHDNGLAQTPPMGWSHWNHFECNINETIIRENVDAMISLGLPALGYQYVNIDDCWADFDRDSEGNLIAHPATFPSGIKALADFVHKSGLKFGLYSDAGYKTCIGNRAASLGHELQDALRFASWGVDHLKYDNCYHDGSPEHVRYAAMGEALNKTGRPILYSICEWGTETPALWAPKYGNSWRTSRDAKDRWKRVKLLADDNNIWAAYAGPGGWNDPDMLQVGNGRMSLAEYRSHFSLWALMKAPLIIGCDLRMLDKRYLEIITNKEIIDVNQDPLGVQGRKVSQQGFCNCLEVWAGPLSGGRIALVLWNRGWMSDVIIVKGHDLGLPLGAVTTIRDLWAHKNLPEKFTGSMQVKVGSHGCKMYLLTVT